MRAQGFELRIDAPAGVPPGTDFEALLLGRSLVRLVGYSASVRYDDSLTLRTVSIEGTPWASADLVLIDEQPASETVSIGVVLDTDGEGLTDVEALAAKTFARLLFTTAAAPAVATIGFNDDPDFNLLVDVDLNGYDSGTDLRLTETQVVVRSGGDEFLRGDCNNDGKPDIADAIFHLRRLFLGGRRPDCDDACDTNDTGELDISDPVWLLSHLFIGGPAPPPPFPAPGVDPTADSLLCSSAP